MALRVHVGCGRVYLDPADGWKNCDLRTPGRFLASERPDIVERWKTRDGDAYYARQNVSIDDVARGPIGPSEQVCDAYCDVLAQGLPCGLSEADEILARQVVEHWSLADFRRFLRHCDYALKPEGTLRLDVPDLDATLALLEDPALGGTQRALMRRHMLGHRGGDGDCHYLGYSRTRLRAIVESEGFTFAREEPPLAGRWYPAFCLAFVKPTLATMDPLPWQRFYETGEIPDHWRILEVGPGSRRFFPRACAVVDIIDRGGPDLPPGARFVQQDICDRTPFGDGEFDFAYLSHVVEHVRDPIAMAAEISRIAKRGFIEAPHPMKEFLMGYEEDDHRWWVWPARDGVLRFQRPVESFVRAWRNCDWSASLHRILLSGPGLGSDGMVLRQHFLKAQREGVLNVVHRWEGELRVEVID